LEELFCCDCPGLLSIPERFYPLYEDMIETNYWNYRKEGCKKLVDSILEQLIVRTWEPLRARDWCSFA
jgi:hypothetical protein